MSVPSVRSALAELRAACKGEDIGAIDVATVRYAQARLKEANSGGKLKRASNALGILDKFFGGGGGGRGGG